MTQQNSLRSTVIASGRLGRRSFLGLVGAGVTSLGGVAGAHAATLDTASPGLAASRWRLKSSYRSRAAWGADESRRFDANGVEKFPPACYPLQTVTVHHTAFENGSDHHSPDPAAIMRTLYATNTAGDHSTKDYGDFGYHFLIDEAGVVYEGRYSGDDGIPGFDASGNVVTAAHIAGWNSGNLGIVVLGNFDQWSPTRPALTALTGLLALVAGTHQLDPLGTTNFVNPVSGAEKTVPTISGHGDWVITGCPGTSLKAELPSIKDDVARLLG